MVKSFLLIAMCLSFLLSACVAGTQRGIQENAYVSTARPAVTMKAKTFPLMAGGEGTCNLQWSGGLGGLPVRVWLAIYGSGNAHGMAVVAQADVPYGWYWDDSSDRPFSVDNGVEVFDNISFHASTYIVESTRDPFASILGISKESTPIRWITRGFAARCNFNESKLIMEYRETLPEHLANAKELLIGQTDWLRSFEQRARDAFIVGSASEKRQGIERRYADNVLWRYMDQRFLGTVSRYEPLLRK